MTERNPADFEGEKEQTDELAPENHNPEQEEDAQSHTVAEEALDLSTTAFELEDSEKPASGLDETDEQDLVDHMKQMERSGSIDMSAYAGEPNHDDNVDKYGRRGKLDDLPGDGS